MTRPKDRRYMASHEWAKLDGQEVVIGITDYAVAALTDLTFVDLPESGQKVIEGERFGEIESVKAVSDLYAPLSGTITKVNNALSDEAGLEALSKDPFGAGWMIRLKPDDAKALERLLSLEEYEASLDDH